MFNLYTLSNVSCSLVHRIIISRDPLISEYRYSLGSIVPLLSLNNFHQIIGASPFIVSIEVNFSLVSNDTRELHESR